jgi:hypothetical protein
VVRPMLTLSHPLQRVVLSFDFPFYGHPLRQITIATGGKAESAGLGRVWRAKPKLRRSPGGVRWTGEGLKFESLGCPILSQGITSADLCVCVCVCVCVCAHECVSLWATKCDHPVFLNLGGRKTGRH